MEIDIAIELSKNEIIESINKVSEKYKLPSCLLNQIIQAIANQTMQIANNDLQKHLEEYRKQQEEKEKESE